MWESNKADNTWRKLESIYYTCIYLYIQELSQIKCQNMDIKKVVIAYGIAYFGLALAEKSPKLLISASDQKKGDCLLQGHGCMKEP